MPNIWDKPGEIQRLSRDNLEWDFTVPDKGKMPLEGAAPALINWGSTRHPTLSMSDNGCRLDRFVVNTPFAEDLRSIIKKYYLMKEYGLNFLSKYHLKLI